MNKRKAKIWTQTKGTSAIVLPKDWCRGHKNPNSVELCYDGAIIIFPEGYPEKRKQKLLEDLEPTE